MESKEKIKEVIMTALSEANGQQVAYRDLIRRARQIDPIVSYNIFLHGALIKELASEGLILTWQASGGRKIAERGFVRRRGALTVRISKDEE